MLGQNINVIDSVLKFKDYICKQNGINPVVFDSLDSLRCAHSEYSIEQLKDLIDYSNTLRSFLLQFPIAAFKGNKWLIKNTIINMSNEFLKNANPDLKQELNKSIYAEKFADHLLSIHLLATDYNNMNKSASYLNIPSYFSEMITDDFDKNSQKAMKKLLQISFGDTFLLQKSLANLGMKNQNLPLIEF